MSQFSVRPAISVGRLPEWTRQIRRRAVRSTEGLSTISAQAKAEIPKLATVPKVWCFCVAAVLLSFLFLVTLQYAGIVEVQYELNRAQCKLSSLEKQKVESDLQVEQLSSLKRISEQALKLGMEYPSADGVQVVRVSVADNGKVNVAYVPSTNSADYKP